MERVFDLQTVQLLSDARKEAAYEDEPALFEFKGVNFNNNNCNQEVLENLPNWPARKDDVFVVTYPKAGTTWTQEIMYLAMNGGDIEKTKSGHTMFRIPYLEAAFAFPKLKWFSRPIHCMIIVWCMLKVLFRMLVFSFNQGRFKIPSTMDMIDMMPSPRLLKSHLPEHLLPPQIFSKKAKMVCVVRNPKDLAVSFFHFHNIIPGLTRYDSWDTFFDDFMEGKVPYGKWYDHFLGYWKRRNESNILFLKYEEMKKDEMGAVRQICEFLGYHYSDEILERITRHTTFKSMKKNPLTNPDSFQGEKSKTEGSFMRKGVVGDWKNYFTEEQTKRIDALCEEKFRGSGLEFEYE